MRIWVAGLLALFCAAAAGQSKEALQAFPRAEPGLVRYVLHLDARPDESVLRVEIIVGKTLELDDRNRYFLGGRIEPQPVKGWGYTRYVVARLGPMGGTMMAVDPKAPKVARFVVLGGEPYLVRYNSRLPLVVYVPEDAEVRYRIWSTAAEAKPMQKG